MDWYIVIKTINGRRYRYRQKTWRENGRVRTRSEYIGPASDVDGSHPGRDPTSVNAPSPEYTLKIVRPIDVSLIECTFNTLTNTLGIGEWNKGWNNRRRKLLVQENAALEGLYKNLMVVKKEGRDGAFFSPTHDVIQLPPKTAYYSTDTNSATERYYRTFAHELTHWTGHHTRLNRLPNVQGTYLSPHEHEYAREELVAEAGAALLLQVLGFEAKNMNVHAQYFTSWLKNAGNREEALEYAKKESERAVRFILERGIIRK